MRRVSVVVASALIAAVGAGCGEKGISEGERRQYCANLGIDPSSEECEREVRRVRRTSECLVSGDDRDCPTTFTSSEVEAMIAKEVSSQGGAEIGELDCEGGDEFSVGDSLDCDVTLASGEKARLRVGIVGEPREPQLTIDIAE